MTTVVLTRILVVFIVSLVQIDDGEGNDDEGSVGEGEGSDDEGSVDMRSVDDISHSRVSLLAQSMFLAMGCFYWLLILRRIWLVCFSRANCCHQSGLSGTFAHPSTRGYEVLPRRVLQG